MRKITKINPNNVYTLTEVAIYLQINPRTLLRYINNGKLKKVAGLHDTRILGADLIKFMN